MLAKQMARFLCAVAEVPSVVALLRLGSVSELQSGGTPSQKKTSGQEGYLSCRVTKASSWPQRQLPATLSGSRFQLSSAATSQIFLQGSGQVYSFLLCQWL